MTCTEGSYTTPVTGVEGVCPLAAVTQHLVLLGQGHVLLEFLPFGVFSGFIYCCVFNTYMCFRK